MSRAKGKKKVVNRLKDVHYAIPNGVYATFEARLGPQWGAKNLSLTEDCQYFSRLNAQFLSRHTYLATPLKVMSHLYNYTVSFNLSISISLLLYYLLSFLGLF